MIQEIQTQATIQNAFYEAIIEFNQTQRAKYAHKQSPYLIFGTIDSKMLLDDALIMQFLLRADFNIQPNDETDYYLQADETMKSLLTKLHANIGIILSTGQYDFTKVIHTCDTNYIAFLTCQF